MTTPTNWPNPERPGVPMFPERDGWHVLKCHGLPSLVRWRPADPFARWIWVRNLARLPDHVGEDVGVVYVGPVLTPTQIVEMLAGERERVAKEIEALEDNWMGASDGNNALQDAIGIIRNLGAAP